MLNNALKEFSRSFNENRFMDGKAFFSFRFWSAFIYHSNSSIMKFRAIMLANGLKMYWGEEEREAIKSSPCVIWCLLDITCRLHHFYGFYVIKFHVIIPWTTSSRASNKRSTRELAFIVLGALRVIRHKGNWKTTNRNCKILFRANKNEFLFYAKVGFCHLLILSFHKRKSTLWQWEKKVRMELNGELRTEYFNII